MKMGSQLKGTPRKQRRCCPLWKISQYPKQNQQHLQKHGKLQIQIHQPSPQDHKKKESDVIKETQKLQTVEYFKKKRLMQAEQQESLDKQSVVNYSQRQTASVPELPLLPAAPQQQVVNVELTSSTQQQQQQDTQVNVEHRNGQQTFHAPVINSPPTNLMHNNWTNPYHLLPAIIQPIPTHVQQQTSHHMKEQQLMALPQQPSTFSGLLSTHYQIDTETVTNMDSGKSFHSTASTISEGLKAVYGAYDCTSCEQYRSTIDELREENRRLQDEIHILRGNSDADLCTRVLKELEDIVNKYGHKHSTPLPKKYSRTFNSYSSPQLCHPQEPEHDDHSMEISVVSNASVSTGASNYFQPKNNSTCSNIDKLETVENYQAFFTAAPNKIKLVEGHSLFIDATQLQAMKNKSKRNASKFVRELLSHFFTAEYLGSHSATGAKSVKKGLPVEIMEPIRVYMSKNYKFEETNVVTNRKCLDVTRKVERPKCHFNGV